MKNIILVLVISFFISDCSADARVLAELLSKTSAKSKNNVLANKKAKERVKTSLLKPIKPKLKPKPKIKDIKPKEIVTSKELEIKNNIAYMPSEDKPFTGKHEEYHSNKKTYIQVNYKDGKRNGLLVMWDEYGHKIGQLTFIDGNQQEN